MIVYLHGFASSPGSKKARFFAERLRAAGREVLIPALDGGDFENLTITGQLRVIEQTAGERPVTLMGSSMGGYLAALYASRHPEVERLVLFAPAFGFARRWLASLDPERREEWQRTGRLPFFHYGEGRERSVGYALIEDGERYEDEPPVSQPTLIFHGANDATVPAELSVRFAAARPNVELHVLESDHELIDQLETMWARTAQFLIAGK
ncbi:MAG: YqiA/YcfP family alpha/beta fold hydrolase [Bryobacteraceae bacterium]|nr:YqiA/YcfP family alpha/beta fold hydrolase [Bryobacteraceae bacterium]